MPRGHVIGRWSSTGRVEEPSEYECIMIPPPRVRVMSREYRLALEIPTGPAYDPEAEPGKLQPLKYRHPFYSSKGKAWYGDVEAVPAVDWRAPALKPANQWGEATFCAFETGMFMIEPRNLIGFR